MKKMIFLAAAAILLIGCGKAETERVIPVESRKQDVINQADQAALAKKQQEEQAAREEEKKKEQKAAAIEEVKEAFSVKTTKVEGPRPDWLKKARGEDITPFAVVKVQYEAIYRMGSAFRNFNSQYIHSFGTLRWEDVGIAEKDANKIYRETAIILMKNPILTLRLSRDAREEAGYYGQGEGTMAFSEGVRIVDYVVNLLREVGAEPKDINLTPEDLRGIALKMYKEEINE